MTKLYVALRPSQGGRRAYMLVDDKGGALSGQCHVKVENGVGSFPVVTVTMYADGDSLTLGEPPIDIGDYV